jgi:hypothetical protein
VCPWWSPAHNALLGDHWTAPGSPWASSSNPVPIWMCPFQSTLSLPASRMTRWSSSSASPFGSYCQVSAICDEREKLQSMPITCNAISKGPSLAIRILTATSGPPLCFSGGRCRVYVDTYIDTCGCHLVNRMDLSILPHTSISMGWNLLLGGTMLEAALTC